MGNRKISFTVGSFYHCYSRGIDKCPTFLEESDYWKFLENIQIANQKEKLAITTRRNLTRNTIWKLPTDSPLVRIVAYCLMPNHFHLILEEVVENGISTFMQRLMTAYTMYFNKKYKRSGGLFTSPFRSKFIHDDRYLQEVIEYVHFNPLELIHEKMHETKIKPNSDETLAQYQFSSLPDYIGRDRPQRVLVIKVSP